MSPSSIETVTSLYDIQSENHLSYIIVRHEEFREFCLRLRRLLQATKEIDDECWRQPLRTLRHYRFNLCAAPIEFGNESVITNETVTRLESDLAICCDYFPRFESEVSALIGSLKRLIEGNDNPLFSELQSQIRGFERRAVLLMASRHIPMFAEILERHHLSDSIEILSQQQLRKIDSPYDLVVCIGSSSLFEDFVFRTPRSKHTKVIRYAWLADSDCRRKSLFKGWEGLRTELESRKKVRPAPNLDSTISSSPEVVNDDEPWLTSEELIPRFDLSVVADKFVNRDLQDGDMRDGTVARLVELEGGRGTFLESTETSRALVLDLDENLVGLVGRVSTSSITAGMFVLLRGDNDEDSEYIVPVANRILGKHGPNLREFQRRWKVALRSYTSTVGFDEVITKLKAEGSTKANETNLRNWLSPRNIRTEAKEDFYAIMRVIGMSDIVEKCWEFARQIDSAHRMAGRKVRRELLRQVRNADLTELERLGEMRFELADLGGKPLLALRVIRVSDFTSNVAHHHLNRVFDLEEQ